MLLQPSEDQEFFRDNTAKFLDEQVPVGELRKLRDDPAGFDEKYWRRGAELGWTTLLVGEEHGGGTISGEGLVDLSLIAYEFGRRAAPGPLTDSNVVAQALSSAGGDEHADALADLLSGASVASWCFGEDRARGLDAVALEVRADGSDVVLNGVKRPVESAAQADCFLVTGRTGKGVTQVLVPASTPGVTVEPMGTVDLTRRFARVTFDSVRVPTSAVVGKIAGAAAQADHQLQVAVALLAVESVGAMQTAFDMTVAWAFDRYTFGRPLASYQALKHRFAYMKLWLEAAHAMSDAAVAAVQSGAPDADELLSTAKAFIGKYGVELVHECVQLHGGIGITYEHDLHLYVRRLTVNTALYGTPAEHRQRLADVVEQGVGAA